MILIGKQFIIDNPERDRLGQGGMGVVYRGRDQATGELVAIKVLRTEIVQEDPGLVQRFQREGEALRKLNHPNIVKLLTTIEENDKQFLVMEYVAGGSLYDLLDKTSLMPIEQILQIALDLSDALTRAHRLNIIHRDLKPANVLLATDGTPRLADFGIAHSQAQAQDENQDGLILGTIAYLSPEVCQGQPINALTDIWSFGVMLYEMLTKRVPFPAENPLETFNAILHNPVPDLYQYRPDTPPALADLVYRMLFKDPINRIPSIRLVGAELEMLLHRQLEEAVTPTATKQTNINIHNYYYQLKSTVHQGDTEQTRLETKTLNPIDKIEAPYRGLFHFGPDDADIFFGRDAIIEKLLDLSQNNSLIGLLGASGSGKSSVVLAGLVPTLQRSGHWQFTHFRPGQDPFLAITTALMPLYQPNKNEEKQNQQIKQVAQQLHNNTITLSDILSQIQKNNPHQNLLIIADQFEELYTLCPNPSTRHHFLDNLLNTVQATASPSSDIDNTQKAKPNTSTQYNVITLKKESHKHPPKTNNDTPILTEAPPSKPVLLFTMRADFLAHALNHRPFAEVLQESTLMLGPMNRQELREAIEKPARQVGVTFEAGLVSRILEDVGNEPGNLPLLEFALTLLWEKQTGYTLSHAAYEAIGQVEGALAHHATQTYANLSDVEKEQARRIFIQLVRPGAGTEDTRRLATKRELEDGYWPLIKRLADARLLVTSRDAAELETVEVVHEALIRNWTQLRYWLNEDREFRMWQDGLRIDLGQWHSTQHDEGALLRGVLLGEAEAYLNSHPDYLSSDEKEFIQTSLNFRQRRAEANKREQQEKLESAQKLATQAAARAAERTRTATILSRLIILAFALAIVASLFGVRSYQNANRANQEQATAQVAKDEAIIGRDRASTAEAKALNLKSLAQTAEVVAIKQKNGVETAQAQAIQQKNVAETAQARAIAAQEEAEHQALIALRDKLVAQTQFASTWRPGRIESLPLLLAREVVSLTLKIGEEIPLSVDIALRQAIRTASPWRKTLEGHVGGRVYSAAFSPDGKRVATAGQDGTTRLWDVETGAEIGKLSNVNVINWDVDFSPDGKRVLVGYGDAIARLWDIETETVLQELRGHTGGVSALSFSPDGKLALTGSGDETARLWNVETGEMLHLLTGHNGTIWDVDFSPDGLLALTASNDETVRVWSVETGEEIRIIENSSGSMLSAQFSPDGRLILTGSSDGTARLWSLETGQEIQHLNHPFDVWSTDFSPDGKYVVTGSGDDIIRLWSLARNEEIGRLEGHAGDIFSVSFSNDGSSILSASADTTARLWSAHRNQFDHARQVWSATYSPDGQWVATGDNIGTTRLWNVQTGQEVETFETEDGIICAISFSPDGKLLLTGGDGGTATLWSLETKEIVTRLTNHTGSVCSLSFSPDGQTILTGSYDGTARLWSTSSGEEISVLTGHTRLVFAVNFSLDGQRMVTGDFGGTAHVWDVENTQEIMHFSGHEQGVASAVFSPDGQYLVTGSGFGTVHIWSLETGQEVGQFVGHQEPVRAIDFSPDETLLLTGSYDRTARLWRWADRVQISQIEGHTAVIFAAEFSPDGQSILTAGDSTVRIWPVHLDTLLEMTTALIQRTPPELSPEEKEQFGLK